MRVTNFIFIFVFFSSLILCLTFVDIPRIVKSTGYTTGTKSVSKVISPISGVLVSFLFTDQQRVRQGDVLGEVTTERFMGGHSLDADHRSSTVTRVSALISLTFGLKRAPTTGSSAGFDLAV